MRTHVVLLSLAAAVALAGCGSSKSASKSNFAKAINATLSKDCISINPTGGLNAFTNGSKYPIDVRKVEASNSFFTRVTQEEADKRNAENFGRFEALVKAGLLTSTSGEVKDFMGHPAQGNSYALTPEGEKALQRKDYSAFCVGHWQVKEVTNFTEPGKAIDGATRSSAQFTYVAAEIPAWASVAEDAGYPGLKEQLESEGKGSADLVLTNEGWEAHVRTLNAK